VTYWRQQYRQKAFLPSRIEMVTRERHDITSYVNCFPCDVIFTSRSRSSKGFVSFTFLDCVWNVMAHWQKPDFVFRRNGRVHLNRRGLQFSRLLAAEVCTSAVVMLDTSCSEVVWRVLATHSIRQFPLHFPSRASPCAITFQLGSNTKNMFPVPFVSLHSSCSAHLLFFIWQHP
jgi:hypothetical protein